MNWLFVVLGALLASLAFSRLSVFFIDRRWPVIGRIVPAGGVDLHILDIPSPPGAQTLLAIHGASGNLRDPVEALRGALSEKFRLVAVDRPGHGHSSRGSRKMTDPRLQADAIAAALRELGVGPCIVLGHSWGAAVAAAVALRHPASVAGLVLVAPATHPWPGGVSARSRLFALPFVGELLGALVVAPLGLAIVPGAIRTVFAPERPPNDYAARIGAHLAIRPKTMVTNCRDVVDLYGHLVRLSARYPEIRTPTEILTGDVDPIVSPAIHACGLARDIPGARLTVLAGVGHMPHWTATDAVAAAVARVAGRQAGRI